jgi:hypothetical protein
MIYTIKSRSKNFENVTRILAVDEEQYEIELDIHDLFDIPDSFEMNLRLMSTDLADYDYVMNGIIYKKNDNELLISNYGLLCSIKNPKIINNLKINSEIQTVFRKSL